VDDRSRLNRAAPRGDRERGSRSTKVGAATVLVAGGAAQLLSSSLVTVPVTSAVCVAAINLAWPNLARYYLALYPLRPASESRGDDPSLSHREMWRNGERILY